MGFDLDVKCRIAGHNWKTYEKNPDKDSDDGEAARCRRCGKWDWDYREPGDS